MTQPYTDVGNMLAQAVLEQVETSLGQCGVDVPQWMGQVGGVGPPVVDPCAGLIWTRVTTVYPTDGSGAQLTTTRFDSSIPAWVIPVELGHLWCHPVIDPDGSAPDMDEWASFAERDGQYRMVVMHAARIFREEIGLPLRNVVMGQTISPWTPIGPDGGYSGGLVVLNTIVGALALC